jgi:hypothetical protein
LIRKKDLPNKRRKKEKEKEKGKRQKLMINKIYIKQLYIQN